MILELKAPNMAVKKILMISVFCFSYAWLLVCIGLGKKVKKRLRAFFLQSFFYAERDSRIGHREWLKRGEWKGRGLKKKPEVLFFCKEE
jgi:hypothetical protein